MIDGGSTGSRLHVFEFVRDPVTAETDCIRRGSVKAWTPLSSYARPPSEYGIPLNETHVAEHLLPLFDYAAKVVPERFWTMTKVKYGATAGMRLVDKTEQRVVYDSLYGGLISSGRFKFSSMKRDDVDTLGGKIEGFYGAVAANYLKGVISTDLHLKSNQTYIFGEDGANWHNPHSDGPLGALDMGGASAQIVYIPKTGQRTCTQKNPHREINNDKQELDDTYQNQNNRETARLSETDFFSTSYLAYGVDQFRGEFATSLCSYCEETVGDVYWLGLCHGMDEHSTTDFTFLFPWGVIRKRSVGLETVPIYHVTQALLNAYNRYFVFFYLPLSPFIFCFVPSFSKSVSGTL